jgi:hypothetical protein
MFLAVFEIEILLDKSVHRFLMKTKLYIEHPHFIENGKSHILISNFSLMQNFKSYECEIWGFDFLGPVP